MPYVITTGTLEPAFAGHEQRIDPMTATRHAVATLDEARDWIADQHSRLGPYPPHAVADLTEAGGTVGPLPDGTVIEVAHVSWHHIYEHGGSGVDDQQCIDAYNAKQATSVR